MIRVMDHALLNLSAKIKPNEATMKQQSRYAHQILKILQIRSIYKIDRFVVGGSFGKRTNTMQSDADCIYFINDEEPPFDEVLQEFYDICNKFEVKNSFDTFIVRKNKRSLYFEIDGFKMDVVLATNFVNNSKGSLRLAQQREVLKRIKLNPTAQNCYVYSSALTEASNHFIATRSGFANEIARIAKYWFQSLDTDFKHISGASTFIELVAVYASSRKHFGKKRRNPHLKALIRFLELLIDFETLDVSFGIEYPGGHIPYDTTTPCVIDPVNPYNNFAHYWRRNSRDIEAIKSRAAITWERVQELKLRSIVDDVDLINTIFHS